MYDGLIMGRYATITFDEAGDFVHIQYKPVTLNTNADVAAFAREIDREMKRIGRKVDIIVDLGELVVKPSAVSAYDDERQRMFSAYARRAYRYSGLGIVRTRILTSSTLHDQAANVFGSYEQAYEAMLAERARFRT